MLTNSHTNMKKISNHTNFNINILINIKINNQINFKIINQINPI